MALMRISNKFGEVACVESYPNKPCALDAMAVEEGYKDFADLCRERNKAVPADRRKSSKERAARYSVEQTD